MQDLIKQEIFEIEVLEKLKNKRILEPLVFVGGTMLRLCHDLNRYSTDLDFWLIKKVDIKKYFSKIVEALKQDYIITDSQIKFYTILVEIKSDKYPRKLKVEIRKEKECEFEEKIAFSKFTNTQVLLKCATLKQMLENKIEAFLERKEIRDCFDIEFILRRGEELSLNKEKFCYYCVNNFFVFNSILRILTSIILCLNKGFLLHSAGVLENGRCILYSGKSGSGKSTLAKKFVDKKILSDELCPVILINKNLYSWPSMFYSEVKPNFVRYKLIRIKDIKFLSDIDKGKIVDVQKKEDFVDLLLKNIFWLSRNAFLTQRQVDIVKNIADLIF